MTDATKIVTGFTLKPATWRRIGFTMAQYLQKNIRRNVKTLYRRSGGKVESSWLDES